MDCKKVEKMLSDYLCNSLKQTYRDVINQHLAQCQKCTDEFNSMLKLDNLLKLKVREQPSKEYWQGYWPKLERKLNTNAVPEMSGNRRFADRFIPRFAFVMNGVLISMLIFLGGLLYVQNQQIKSLQFVQEETQKDIYKYLALLRTKIDAEANIKVLDKQNVQMLDKLEKGVIQLASNLKVKMLTKGGIVYE